MKPIDIENAVRSLFNGLRSRHFTHPDQQWKWWLDRYAKSDPDESCPLFDGVTE